jgi:hypothetical protein
MPARQAKACATSSRTEAALDDPGLQYHVVAEGMLTIGHRSVEDAESHVDTSVDAARGYEPGTWYTH